MASAADFKPRHVGAQYTTDYRVYLENTKTGQPASPFHDVPLYANEDKTVLNFIVEVSRWSNAKLEISKEEPFNPIKQDIKKGKLRFVRNVFPYHGYIWNYGAFPQTWEDPSHTHPDTQAKGDNDPLDVCEIGEQIGYPGQIKQVKVLGVMALLDEGETDWKVLVIDVNDPLAAKLNDVADFETYLPGLVKSTNEWFRLYKIPDGKPENQFAFDGQAKDKAYAVNVIKECHEAWKRLVSGEANPGEVSIANSSVQGSKGFVAAGDAAIQAVPAANPQPAAAVEQAVAKNFYLKQDKTIAS